MFLFRKKNKIKSNGFVKNISKDDINNLIKNVEKLIVIFYEDYCPFCKKLMKVILENKVFLKSKNIKVYKISPDKYNLWSEDGDTEFRIKLVPTIMIYKNGKIQNRLENSRNIKKITEKFV